MNIIYLYLPDFKGFVRSKSFKGDDNTHPVFYFETTKSIRFYKPIGNVIYATHLIKKGLPADINIKNLTQNDFQAIELPIQPDASKKLSGTYYIGKPLK